MSRGIKLLLVDDHTLFREGIRPILTRLNGIVIVGEAGRGESACAMAAELQPEVVLMDISLPDMNGIDATRRIKEILPDTHVIILSMQSKAAYIEDAFRAGASGYVNKGSTSTHLVDEFPHAPGRLLESQKAETSRFALNDSSDLRVANRRSSGFLRDRQDSLSPEPCQASFAWDSLHPAREPESRQSIPISSC